VENRCPICVPEKAKYSVKSKSDVCHSDNHTGGGHGRHVGLDHGCC
jgi:hypothetical protein